jgi:hypothetical protein
VDAVVNAVDVNRILRQQQQEKGWQLQQVVAGSIQEIRP